MRRAVVFNYDSKFAGDLVNSVRAYSAGKDIFSVEMYRARDVISESHTGSCDIIIHSGGDGVPVVEDIRDVLKLYICFSHQWKAKKEGGEIAKLGGLVKGVHEIDVLEDDDILGKKGRAPIMKYHEYAVIKPPPNARVIATSRIGNAEGKEVEVIEALRYPDGSLSVQGHPEEGTARHIIHNMCRLAFKQKATFV